MQLAVDMQIRHHQKAQAVESGGQAVKRNVALVQTDVMRIAKAGSILPGEMQKKANELTRHFDVFEKNFCSLVQSVHSCVFFAVASPLSMI